MAEKGEVDERMVLAQCRQRMKEVKVLDGVVKDEYIKKVPVYYSRAIKKNSATWRR